jgi:hypothetical protein
VLPRRSSAESSATPVIKESPAIKPPPGILEPTQKPPPGIAEPTQKPPPGIAEPTHKPPPGIAEAVHKPPPGLTEVVQRPPPGIPEPTLKPPPGIPEPVQKPPPGIPEPVVREKAKKQKLKKSADGLAPPPQQESQQPENQQKESAETKSETQSKFSVFMETGGWPTWNNVEPWNKPPSNSRNVPPPDEHAAPTHTEVAEIPDIDQVSEESFTIACSVNSFISSHILFKIFVALFLMFTFCNSSIHGERILPWELLTFC